MQRLRVFLNNHGQHEERGSPFDDGEGTMFNEGEDGDQIVTVTAQANGMMIDEMDEEFGNDSEMMGQD